MVSQIDMLDVDTPLGPGVFEPVELTGSETLSAPFSYELVLRSGLEKIDQTKLLYQPVTVTVAPTSPHIRYVNGMVAKISQYPANSAQTWDYHLTIVPKIAFLEQSSDCRFFESLNAIDIVNQICGKFGLPNPTSRVSPAPPVRPYTVMFNESYLHFINRILAAEGIFYFFEFAEGSHTMVLGNSSTAFNEVPNSPVTFATKGGILSGIDSWHRQDGTTIGSKSVADYNPETSSASIGDEETSVLSDAGKSGRVHYHWPAGAPDKATATKITKRHMQAAEGRAQLYHGNGSVPDLYAGGKFTLDPDPTTGEATAYIVQSFSMAVHDAGRAGSHGGKSSILVACTAFPAETAWQPAYIPKPNMPGIYTATVIGESGEDIFTDDKDMARIKVQFPWDHEGDTTSSGSFWVRVVQPWAGAGWGVQFTPRVGMEVAVAFLEGDIDRPVAIGSLYNSTNMPIFPAAKKNISGFRTRSTLKGGTDDYNEFSFDDTKGSEIVLLHAQKDYNIEVEHDQTLTIDNCRFLNVKKDETVKIDGDQSFTIKGTQTTKVTGAVLHQSQNQIVLKVGESSIKIDNSGITLTATQIKISGTASFEASAPMSTVKGEGMLTLTGGMTKVNC
jgi:type VI secretion system secreted protein VgrG